MPAPTTASRAAPFAAVVSGDLGLIAGRYEVRRHLGSGGSAAVYLGRDRRLDRDVAIKLLRPEYAADSSFVERFRREARAAAALNDPHVVAIYDFGFASPGVDQGRASTGGNVAAAPFIVMEYVRGTSLKDRLRHRGPLGEPEVLRIGAQIAAALEVAHRHGVIHRDIKPHNILLDERGAAKVVDFGLARATSAAQLTHTSIVLGSPYYLSPEQAQGRAVDCRSDVYSLGVVLYELLTGCVPFSGDSPLALAWQHVHTPPRPVSALRPDISLVVEAVVMQALAKDPAQRYQSAAAMQAALVRAQVPTVGPAPTAAARLGLKTAPARFVDVEGLQPLAEPDPVALRPRPVSGSPISLLVAPAAVARRRASVRLAAWLALAAVSLASAPVAARLGGSLALIATGGGHGAAHQASLALPAIDAQSAAPASLAPTSAAANDPPSQLPPRETQAPGEVALSTQVPSDMPAVPATPAATPAEEATPGPASNVALAPTKMPAAPIPRQPVLPAGPLVASAPAAPLGEPAASTSTAVAPASNADSPAQAVVLFYQLVAQHQFGSAIGLWTARMQAAFPPGENVVRRFGQTQQVLVQRASVVAFDQTTQRATVAVDVLETVGVPPTTRHWVGTWQLVHGAAGWLLDQPNLAPA